MIVANRPVQTLPRIAVTVAEASEMTGISRDILYRHIERGTLPAARPSKAWVIVLDDLTDFLQRMKDAR